MMVIYVQKTVMYCSLESIGWLVGWFVKGASPHRKVHSMLGFSNVGMLALLKDSSKSDLQEDRKKKREWNKSAITYRSKQSPFFQWFLKKKIKIKKYFDFYELSIISA